MHTLKIGLPIVVIAAAVGAYFALRPAPIVECVSQRLPVEVRGTSLLPLHDPGTQLTLEVGYYTCRRPQHDELAIHRFKDIEIVKIIKAVPGDRLSIEPCANARCIAVNDALAHTSTGDPYYVTPQEERLLSMYVKDYIGVVPAKAVLLLSNRSAGTIDSRSFGLVSTNDLVGRARDK